ncbi:MAG TPA: EcsC family protein [Thermoanaerobaculia bacterium]|nr:EcsC family protein [Thermoanaerobaculia bacterium]
MRRATPNRSRKARRRAKRNPKRRARAKAPSNVHMDFAPALEQPQLPTRKIVEQTMGRAKDIKRRADTMLEELFRAMFEEIDTDKLRKEVDELRDRAPDFQPAQHARVLARRTAIRCAAAGALTGLPLGIATIGTLGADLAYLVYQQFRMILGIATIYGHEPTSRERFTEALSCLAFGSGVGIGKQGMAAMLGSATIEGGIIAEKIGARFMRDRLSKLVPFVGIISGGALNYAAVYAVGRTAIRYYDARVDATLADEIWAEGDREHA